MPEINFFVSGFGTDNNGQPIVYVGVYGSAAEICDR